MTLLLFFIFGVLITVVQAEKCCKFYVSPPSTVLVQLKNHNIIGAVPRQAPAPHYSSHLLPPQSTAPPNNFFLLNYHANVNPNNVYHTPPPQTYMQNGMYGFNQGSYAAPAWQQTYYQPPGYLPATMVPQATYALPQNETKKQASYYVSSAFFANSTEVNENNLPQKNNPIMSQHQLGDYLRNAENSTTTQVFVVKDDATSEDAFSMEHKAKTYTQNPTIPPTISTQQYQSNPPTMSSTNYQEIVREITTADNNKQQPLKTSSTSFAPTTSNSQTTQSYTTVLQNDTVPRNNAEQIYAMENAENKIGIQQQKGTNTVQKHNTAPSKNLTNNTQSFATTVGNTIQTQNSQKSVNTTPTIFVPKTTQENYSTQSIKQHTNNSSQTTIQSSKSTKTISLEPTSTLSTTTVFIPGHRDAQKYGNNPYEDNSVGNLKSINVILLLSVITYSILTIIR